MHAYYSYSILKCSRLLIADTISFNQSVYDADEENKLIQIVLVLTNPLPNNTVIQVISNNINATGRLISMCTFNLSIAHRE